MKKPLLILVFAFLVIQSYSIPPDPPLGYRWVLIQELSDEFEGSKLNENKWFDYHPYWEGRAPAKFVPEAVSVNDGYMQIENGVLPEQDRNYKYAGGAVCSKRTTALFGYYECKFKASKTRMSTTFWMSNRANKLQSTSCTGDSYSLELDIQECIGDADRWEGFKKKMNSNTHYWYTDCNGNKETYSEGADKELSTEVWEDFHTYGAWWKNENEVTFYADDEKASTVRFKTDASSKPFDQPMAINMVTETYSWETEPRVSVLTDTTRNTSYYDWIRSYQLLPVDSVYQTKEEEIMKNSDFETGDLSNWGGWGGNPLEVSDDSYEGNYAVRIVGAGAPEQSITLKKNTDYKLSCHAKVRSGQVSLGVKPTQGNNEALSSITVSDSVYTLYDLNFNTGENSSVKIYYYAPGSSDEGFADNFVIEELNQDTTNTENEIKIFNDAISFYENPYLYTNGTLELGVVYQTNEEKSVQVLVKDKSEEIAVFETTVLEGYGSKQLYYEGNNAFIEGENITIIVNLLSEELVVASDTINTTVQIKTTSEELVKSDFYCYPNPAANYLHLKNVDLANPLEIFNLAGKTMRITPAAETIDISDLDSGFYFIKNGLRQHRFIKQ